MRGGPALAAAGAALLLAGCGGASESGGAAAESEAAAAAPPPGAAVRPAPGPDCTAGEARAQLRRAVFEKARALRPEQAALLDRLAMDATVSVATPMVRGRDPALGVVLCRARVTVALPEGVTDAFGGASVLASTLDYAVQRGRGAGVAVHPLRGADPIVYRLAAIALEEEARGATEGAGDTVVEAAASGPARRPPSARAESGERATRTAAAAAPPARAAPRPSFDCRRPRSTADRLVCGDRWLATLDRETDLRFRRALAASDAEGRERLHRTQARFLGRMERCDRRHCVEDVYQDRMKQIARILRRG